LIAVALLVGASARAHHSFAQFDQSRTVVVSGTFKKLELGNPHTRFWVSEALPNGVTKLWQVEGGGASQVRVSGMSVRDFFASTARRASRRSVGEAPVCRWARVQGPGLALMTHCVD
jgi:hypothetical protein